MATSQAYSANVTNTNDSISNGEAAEQGEDQR